MLTRMLIAGAIAAFSIGAAQAGTLTNGVYTPNCPTAPGDAPPFSTKSPDAFNKSAKEVQAWQQSVTAYNDCMKTEVKADQEAIVGTYNTNIKRLSDQISGVNAAQQEAVEALKKKGGK